MSEKRQEVAGMLGIATFGVIMEKEPVRSWIIWYVIFLHTWWGASYWLSPPAGADWHGGVSWNIYINLGGGDLWTILMLVGAALAAVSMLMDRGAVSISLLLLQQVVLTIGAIGMLTGFFGFYHEFEGSRVLRVAPIHIGAFLFHTIAILDSYHVFRWRR